MYDGQTDCPIAAASKSAVNKASSDRLREVEHRMFVADRFDDEFFAVQEEGKGRYLLYSVADQQFRHLVSLDRYSTKRPRSFSTDAALGVAPAKDQEAKTVLSGPLDLSKVTMKPARKSPEDRRRSTLLLLGVDPDKPKSK